MTGSVKKFWRSCDVQFSHEHNAYVILLDSKVYRSKKGNIVKVPSLTLANKVKKEWQKVKNNFSSSKLEVTNFLEQINEADQKQASLFLKEIMEYAESDLICYRVPKPEGLRKLQDKKWDDIFSIYHDQFGIKLFATYSLEHVAQSKKSMNKLKSLLRMYNQNNIIIIYKMTQILGSALLSILVRERLLTVKKAWLLSRIEEEWQQKTWGVDQENDIVEKNKWEFFKFLNVCLKEFN